MKILVTGAAGFVGYHSSQRFLQAGHEIVGLDNLNAYYDVGLKKARLENLKVHQAFTFVEAELSDRVVMEKLFQTHRFDRVIHLAAQAGVRYSIDHPHAYVESNIIGFLNILEGCRHTRVPHLVYASSSSVYGLNTRMPFRVADRTEHPISLYAATKKANELFAHTYSHLYGIPATGLRFFTVYGPWGRPDMAPFLFTDAISKGNPIKVFNEGKMQRDFTYVDDIVEGVVRVANHIPLPNPGWKGVEADPSTTSAPHRLYNIGNNNPVELMRFIAAIESALGKKAICEYLPMQPGDIMSTAADISTLTEAVGFRPETSIEDGMKKFCAWYQSYYGKA
jgi:UDP-glucuronate 4-epimerase